VTIVVIYNKIGLVEFDNEAITLEAFKEYTNANFTDKTFENFNWKSAKPFKEDEIFIRVGCKDVI
jgi:hypothetical protein